MTVCPSCSTTLVTAAHADPWCPACTWNLGRYEPERHRPEFGWRPVDRWTRRVAYRLSRRQFDRLAGAPVPRTGATATRILLYAVSAVLLAAIVACAVLGAWLVLYDFPGFSIVPGLALLALAAVLRPRLGRLSDDVTELRRSTAPELFALVDRVAAAAGVRPPDVLGVHDDLNAYTTAVGLRRRRVLVIGLPLHATLSAQAFVALLGHELGHFANGDARRRLLTQLASRSLGEAAGITAPGAANEQMGIAGMVSAVVQWVLSRVLFGLHLLLLWAGLRDGQRAEYLADDLAARIAGRDAAVELSDSLLAADGITTVLRREMRAGPGVGAWRAAAVQVVAGRAEQLPVLRQLSIRDEVSLFAAHPPAGLRVHMLLSRPATAPAVVLSETAAARIDAELAAPYERFRRDVLWS